MFGLGIECIILTIIYSCAYYFPSADSPLFALLSFVLFILFVGLPFFLLERLMVIEMRFPLFKHPVFTFWLKVCIVINAFGNIGFALEAYVPMSNSVVYALFVIKYICYAFFVVFVWSMNFILLYTIYKMVPTITIYYDNYRLRIYLSWKNGQ